MVSESLIFPEQSSCDFMPGLKGNNIWGDVVLLPLGLGSCFIAIRVSFSSFLPVPLSSPGNPAQMASSHGPNSWDLFCCFVHATHKAVLADPRGRGGDQGHGSLLLSTLGYSGLTQPRWQFSIKTCLTHLSPWIFILSAILSQPEIWPFFTLKRCA